MMKVFQINCSASGSTGQIADAIHMGLNNAGNENVFAYGIGRSQHKNTYPISSWLETHVHDQLSKITGMQGYFSAGHTLYLLYLLKKEDPDIIHLHNVHGNYLCLPLLFRYLSKCRAKVVITLHDCWLFTGKCPYYTHVGCERWMADCGDCCQLGIYPKSYWFDRSKKNLKDKKAWMHSIGAKVHLVAVSDWLMGETQKSFLKGFPVSRIYNGIDCDVFHPTDFEEINRKYQLCGKKVILGVASVWDDRKGLRYFQKLADQLVENEIIILVGLSDVQIRDLPGNIIGIQRTENKQELVALYSRADVLFHASAEETFGMVVAEALACGTPAVVFDSTACPEVISQETGICISAGRVDAAHEEIQKILCCDKKQYTYRCVERVAQHFEKTRMVNEYLKLYNHILSEYS